MAALIVAAAAGIVFAGQKVHERKKNKRALKAQDALQHGLVEEVSAIDGTMLHHQSDNLPAYHKENLPPYHTVNQHPAFRTNKQREGSLH
jgi:hypothetical protein